MNDDQMDEMLIQGVRDYNAPGDSIPRDEMWRRIQEARAAAKADRSPIVSIDGRRRSRWVWPSVGVAAAALVAIGIGIGRRLEHQSGPKTELATNASSAPAVRPSPTAPSTDSATKLLEQMHAVTRGTDSAVRAIASAPTSTGSTDVGGSSGAAGQNGQSLAYRLVVLQHLVGSEAMITSFRSSARTGHVDAEVAKWSRELLSTTRLLEASQASTDPVMKRLLEDLDLVISQIVQYTEKGTMSTEELDLIEQSIDKRGVMSQLRSTIPSRTLPAGT